MRNKSLGEIGIPGPYLYIIKAIYNKLIANIKLNEEKLKEIFTKISNKTRLFTLSMLMA